MTWYGVLGVGGGWLGARAWSWTEEGEVGCESAWWFVDEACVRCLLSARYDEEEEALLLL
jgi:hypothetical protein